MLLHQLAWLVAAAGVVVEDRGYTSTSTVYAALDLGPQRFVVAVALKATPAEIETTATTFCREHRDDITTLAPGLDGAWAADACATRWTNWTSLCRLLTMAATVAITTRVIPRK